MYDTPALSADELAAIRRRMDPARRGPWEDIPRLLATLAARDAKIAALRSQVERMREIVARVADAGAERDYTGTGVTTLLFCPGDDAEDIRDRARALLRKDNHDGDD